MATGNPIWDVHDGLWDLLEDTGNASHLIAGSKHFTNLVSDNHWQRIKFTSPTHRNPLTEVESSTDLPKVAIFHARGRPKDRPASNASRLIIQWEILVRTGDQRFDDLMDIEWAVFCQLMNWDSLKTSVVWNSTVYPVKDCNLLSCEESMFDERQNMQLRGWRAVWVGETDMWFPHATIVT